MSLVDLLVTILVATILITIGIGLVTYLVYKLRHARVRDGGGEAGAGEGRYFVPYEPPDEETEDGPVVGEAVEASTADPGDGSAGGGTSGGARGS